MKIGKSIVFEVENQKMKVKTGFGSNMGHIRGKNNKKCLNWSMIVKLLQKKSKATLAKLCSNKEHNITKITGKFHFDLHFSSFFMAKLQITIFQTIFSLIWKLHLV